MGAPREPIHVVWFKRDLRIHDHRPLTLAAARGPVVPLYVVEPDFWRAADASARHWQFIRDSLNELDQALAQLGQRLIVRTGSVVDVLRALHSRHPIAGVWSHEETGNAWTFQRDVTIGAFLRASGIPWTEIPQNGVVRRLRSRDGWARRWQDRMSDAITPPPHGLQPVPAFDPGPIPETGELGLRPDGAVDQQAGGRAHGVATLRSFLDFRGMTYRRAMSSPLEGAAACSRLSPHLAFGTVSLREVYQAHLARMAALAGDADPEARAWRGALASFGGRLHWHCHFMQKLEDEPSIEFQEFHPVMRGTRELGAHQDRLQAWAQGQTGFPFLDACMRSLKATGWLNFRMRAMVQSFACYNLWLHWRDSGLELARLFTDYEPGIHWAQAQMQAGTTGINTIRIYNVIKQGRDQDAAGSFTRRWVPELSDVPDAFLQEPWLWPGADAIVGRLYPKPIVDLAASTRMAKNLIFDLRQRSDFAPASDEVQDKHGSRKAGLPMTGARGRRPKTSPGNGAQQLKLDL